MESRSPVPSTRVQYTRLTRSALGGYSLDYNGVYIGWIHSAGTRWKAHLRIPGDGFGRVLGVFDQDTAIETIVENAIAAGYVTRA